MIRDRSVTNRRTDGRTDRQTYILMALAYNAAQLAAVGAGGLLATRA